MGRAGALSAAGSAITCPIWLNLDNWGASKHPGQAKQGGIWVWGYDEITWFAHQSVEYRANWLRYVWDWVQKTDPNGHLQMPGSRTMRSPLDNKRWYYANAPSPAVPEGLDDEEAIRAIWSAGRSEVIIAGQAATSIQSPGKLAPPAPWNRTDSSAVPHRKYST